MKYSSKPKQKRNEAIKKMFAEKKISYVEIGRRMGLSRQRVHQIITGYYSPALLAKTKSRGVSKSTIDIISGSNKIK
jgi:hypothetical protein